MKQVNTLAKKIELLDYLEDRLEKLKKLEEKEGKFLPETRETATCIYNLLEKIRIESGGFKESHEEMKERIFGDWVRKGKKNIKGEE